MENLELVTKRLRLVPVQHQDLNILHHTWTKPEVRKYLWDDIMIPIEQTDDIISTSINHFEKDEFGLWLIRKKDTNEAIGFVGLWFFFDEKHPQLLYGLDPNFQGFGFATEAAQRIMDWALEHLKFDELIASCDVPNIASIRVINRLGMSFHKQEVVDGKPTVFYVKQHA
ncbi:GNAT family N-acetyltransferase [Fulvivirgaceae bacterium BMA10]|uniref:GNAT family N-acetyltransferase n=1 Tax=Splendidivirga corallicola TaxID=3051826 RepID=A0ABT8KQY0_9BACT|nr:GNAT family N-acetyltransferase [Fulvivirgaceae bacterium BMA10]